MNTSDANPSFITGSTTSWEFANKKSGCYIPQIIVLKLGEFLIRHRMPYGAIDCERFN